MTIIQGFLNGLIVICAVTCVSFMPLGDAMTLIFTSPLSTMIVAAIFLGHRMRLYRIFNALLLISGKINMYTIRTAFLELDNFILTPFVE